MKPDFSKPVWRWTVMWSLMAFFCCLIFEWKISGDCICIAHLSLLIAMTRHDWLKIDFDCKK